MVLYGGKLGIETLKKAGAPNIVKLMALMPACLLSARLRNVFN